MSGGRERLRVIVDHDARPAGRQEDTVAECVLFVVCTVASFAVAFWLPEYPARWVAAGGLLVLTYGWMRKRLGWRWN